MEKQVVIDTKKECGEKYLNGLITEFMLKYSNKSFKRGKDYV